MKAIHQILSLTVLSAAFGIALPVLAQSQMSGPNGLAASPRLRHMLSERPVFTTVAVAPVAAIVPATVGSPRVQKQLSEQPKSGLAYSAPVMAGYQAGIGHPIAASPKLQEQLNERSMQFQIAPLK